MNIALVNPIAATPAYTARDFLLHPSVPRIGNGTLRETNLVELGGELSRRGHRVTVVFGDLFMDGEEVSLGDGLRVVAVPTRFRVPFHPGLVPVTPGLVDHPALRDADVIQASEFHQPATFFASLVARDRAIPVVVWQETFRRMRFPGSAYQRAFEVALGPSVRRAGRRFVPRTTRATSFLRGLGVEERDIASWIPTGIDTSAYVPRQPPAPPTVPGWPADARILLLVARLHRSKGIDFALHVVKWLLRREPRVRLAVRGSGPELGRLQRLAKDLGISHAVRFLPPMPRPDLVDLYNASDLVLCTSENDLLPFALIEGSSCGRACVAADVGAVRDIVEDGATGVVVPRRKVEEFGQAVLSLLRDDDRRAEWGRAGRVRAERVFALPLVARRLEEVYRGVAG